MLLTWLLCRSKRTSAPPKRRPGRPAPRLEPLEDRLLLDGGGGEQQECEGQDESSVGHGHERVLQWCGNRAS